MFNYKNYIATSIEKLNIGLTVREIADLIEIPPDEQMGDYAFPCFRLSKTMKKAPNLIAQELVSEMELSDDYLLEIKNLGPYINFFINPNAMAEAVFEEVKRNETGYGSSAIGNGKSVLIEYSSTNIAKPFHIGHLRSTVIGDSLKRIHRYLGYDVEGINYLGDFGTQFGIMIAAYKRWGDPKKIEGDPIKELLNLYVRYNQEAADSEEMMDEARKSFLQLENGDEEAFRLWQWFKDLSLEEFKRVYDLLGIQFDSYKGESYHSKYIPQVVDSLKEKNLLVESDGAMIVELDEFNLPPAIVIKSNGSSTYIARDIATAIQRKKDYDFYRNVYVVATQQNLHFQQLKAILSLMGYDWYEECVHISFGMISLKSGAMQTRTGNVVFLEDVLNKSIEKSREIMESREQKDFDMDTVARQVGIGAVKYQDLFNNRIKDYVFDWEQSLNFDGETGPYVQYSCARANSILQREEFEKDYDIKVNLTLPEEKALIKSLYQFPAIVLQAADKMEPSIITRHITEIAKNFNKFYAVAPILNSEADVKATRLLLTHVTKNILETGLNLLGIEAPEKM